MTSGFNPSIKVPFILREREGTCKIRDGIKKPLGLKKTKLKKKQKKQGGDVFFLNIYTKAYLSSYTFS